MNPLRSAVAGLACALLLAAAPSAMAGSLDFSVPVQLPHGDPKGTPYYSGGEPSLAFDPTGDGHVYVTAPQGIPAGFGNGQGVAYWASDDHGTSFARSGLTGTANGGGDSDVEVLGDHSVLVADLEAADANICISTDFAHTFPDCTNGITSTTRTGPENDREWLTRGTQPGVVYLTYHDFTAGFPIIEVSTDGGHSFSPCANIIDPSGPAAQTYTPSGGTLVSKPVVGRDGTIYVEFSTPDQTAPPVGATLDNLYMAVLPKGACGTTAVFQNHVIYRDSGADLAKIFQATGIDAGGELYVLAAGRATAGETGSNLHLFTSTDGGTTWVHHPPINPPALLANVFPAIAGGQGRGEAVLGWFGTTTSGDPNDGKDQWRFYAAATYDGGASLNYTTVSPDVMHYGDICTQGIFCVTGGNRNLADFASAAVDPSNGCAALAIPGDPYNRPDMAGGANNFESSAYVSLQQDPTACLTAANAGKPAGAVGRSASSSGLSGCLDRIPPTSRFLRSATRASRSGVRFRGRASDRGCLAGGRGKVSRVRVAIGRKQGSRCRFVRADGSYGPLVSCLRTTYLSARGAASWRFAFSHRLRPGAYIAWSRAIDVAGNIERKITSRRHLLHFRVR